VEGHRTFLLTGFADEISPDLDVQVKTLARLGFKGLDLRSVEGTNVLDLTLDDLQRVNEKCREHGLEVTSIGSPVNKIGYDILLQGREHERLRRACKAATTLDCKRVRVFTPEVPEGEHDAMASTIIGWMRDQRRLAEGFGVKLIHENDAKFWGAYPLNAKRMFEEIGGESFRACFDFANAELLGYRAMDEWFPWLLPHLDSLHIKDAKGGQIVPAGEGDSQIEPTLRWLVEQGWTGPTAIEPHLQAAGPFGGFSGEQLFEEAATAFRGVVGRAGGHA
jgi:sugar phosphate isomerase/epimerase